MRHNYLIPFSFFLLIILLPSCDQQTPACIIFKKIIEKKSDDSRATHQSPARNDGLVTLKPPYPGKWNKEDRKPRLCVGNAVEVITDQANVAYNQKKSQRDTYPLFQEWTYPNFENKPWKEALEEVLAPVDLTFVMEDNQVVLMKIEDARRREQQIQKIASEMPTLLESKDLNKLHDAAIIFPLTDSRGLTTELGTFLSELGMLKATYVPQKVLNLHFPAIVEMYRDWGYTDAGERVTADRAQRTIHRFGASDTANGTLAFDAGKNFNISLTFSGRNGKKEFTTSGAEGDLYVVPQWMAQCVHEYCGISLSSKQRQYAALPEVNDTTSLYNLLKLDQDYQNGKRDCASWRRLLKHNPNSAYTVSRLADIQQYDEEDSSIDSVRAALSSIGVHDLLRYVEADWYQRKERYYESIPLYLSLFKTDLRNPALFEQLDTGLLALGFGKEAESLHTLWEQKEPNSYLPLLSKGDFHISYAWNARGHGWASSVTKEGREKMRQRLHLAEKYLTKAMEMNPDDPDIATKLIGVAVGLGYERDQMEKWFRMAIEADPAFYPAYSAKLRYLMPKWYGDLEGKEMLTFARECAAHPPQGSDVGLILVDAHAEMARWANRSRVSWTQYYSYYSQPEVWMEISNLYEQYLKEHPDSVSVHNYYAKLAYYVHDYKTAVRQFQIIGKDIDKDCWQEQFFYKCRAEAYKATGRT